MSCRRAARHLRWSPTFSTFRSTLMRMRRTSNPGMSSAFSGCNQRPSETPLHISTITGISLRQTRAKLPTGYGVSTIAPIFERTFNQRGREQISCFASVPIIRSARSVYGKHKSDFGPEPDLLQSLLICQLAGVRRTRCAQRELARVCPKAAIPECMHSRRYSQN